jgi:hypothetical protein
VQACVRKRRSRTDTSPAPTAQQQQYWIRRGRELARVRETEAVRCRRYKYAHTHTCTAKHANREPIAPASQWPEVKHLVLLYTFHAALACSPSTHAAVRTTTDERRSYGRQIRPLLPRARALVAAGFRVGRTACPGAAYTMDQRTHGRQQDDKRGVCPLTAIVQAGPSAVFSHALNGASFRGQSQTHMQGSGAMVATVHVLM